MEGIEPQAARRATVFAPSDPRRGTRGNARQRHGPEKASAHLPPAHGGLPGEKAHARVASTPPVIGPADAGGPGPEDGQGAPLVAGARATGPARGLPADALAGRRGRAGSPAQRAGHVKHGVGEPLEADRPEPPGRACAPRGVSQGR